MQNLDLSHFPEFIQKGFIDNDLQKGGVGSRGGIIIGHTKSGNPIYDSASHQSHKNFTSKIMMMLEKFIIRRPKNILLEDIE